MLRKMKTQMPPLPLLLLATILLFILPAVTYAKSVIEPCSSSESCTSLLAYLLPWESKLSEIASLFQTDIFTIISSNFMHDPFTNPSLVDQILPAKSLMKIPLSCPCIDGIRRSVSTAYMVRAADTINSISEGYGRLVSPQQIRTINGINSNEGVMTGQSLVIPLPCACFNSSNNGVTAVYMSYVVRKGESLSSIGARYGTTVMDLEEVNGLGQAVVDPGDILAVPIPACSSANLGWYNESLIVSNGSYALTANTCIKCGCGPSDLKLRCVPSGIAASCSHLQCKGSDLFIGDVYENQTTVGCNVTACVYRGHSGRKIFRSSVNSSQIHCSGNRSQNAMLPPTHDPVVPFLTFPPSLSPSPSSASDGATGIGATNPMSKENSNDSDGSLLSKASCHGLYLLELMSLYSIFFN